MDLSDVTAIVGKLRDHGIRVWLFGGWAEESLGLVPARPHKDVDLLYPAEHFSAVDEFIVNTSVYEFEAKRSSCSRAFEHQRNVVEFYLVQHDAQGAYTDFWGYVHRWPPDTLSDDRDFPTASRAALASARSVWAHVERSYDAYPE